MDAVPFTPLFHPHPPPLTGELGTPQPATREQKQRIIAGESAAAVLNEGRVGIGGTLDWSKIALTAALYSAGRQTLSPRYCGTVYY